MRTQLTGRGRSSASQTQNARAEFCLSPKVQNDIDKAVEANEISASDAASLRPWPELYWPGVRLVGEVSPSNTYADLGNGRIQSIEANHAEWVASQKKKERPVYIDRDGTPVYAPTQAPAWKWGL